MKKRIIGTLILALAGTAALSQSAAEATSTPKQVVEEFLKFETEGGRLTPEGLQRASRFFSRSAPEDKNRRIIVVTKAYSVDQMRSSGDGAKIYVGYHNLGEIDSALRYEKPNPKYLKYSLIYNVVRTGNADTPEWKIEEDPWSKLMLSRDAALEYVTTTRQRTTDPSVKSNADRTIAILKRLVKK